MAAAWVLEERHGRAVSIATEKRWDGRAQLIAVARDYMARVRQRARRLAGAVRDGECRIACPGSKLGAANSRAPSGSAARIGPIRAYTASALWVGTWVLVLTAQRSPDRCLAA